MQPVLDHSRSPPRPLIETEQDRFDICNTAEAVCMKFWNHDRGTGAESLEEGTKGLLNRVQVAIDLGVIDLDVGDDPGARTQVQKTTLELARLDDEILTFTISPVAATDRFQFPTDDDGWISPRRNHDARQHSSRRCLAMGSRNCDGVTRRRQPSQNFAV